MKNSYVGVVLASVFFIACKEPNPDVCCVTTEQCSEIGVTDFRQCDQGLACKDHRCVVPTDGGVDASLDAPVDAPGVHVFDIAYPNEWRFSVEGPVSGYFLAINTSNTALNMTSLEIKAIDDDHPTALVRITAIPSATFIPSGTVGGALSGASTQLLVTSGLVTETRSDTTSDYLMLAVENAPNGTYDINVNLELAIAGVRFPVPMKIHVLPAGGIAEADPVAATRKPIYD